MFLLKLLLVPLLIALVSRAADVFGPRVAGMLTGVPVVGGPVLFFLAIEQGLPFAAVSASQTLAAEASLAAFCIIYALGSRHLGWAWCLALGWAGFLGTSACLLWCDMSPRGCLAVGIGAPWVLIALMPRATDAAPFVRTDRSTNDLPWRMVSGAALVLVLTGLARPLGPRPSGLLAIFPVVASVLAVFSHRSLGSRFAVQLLRGLALGLNSLTAFFSVLAFGLQRLGLIWGFLAALTASLGVQAGLLGLLALRRAAQRVTG